MNKAMPIIDEINSICGFIIAILSYVLGEHWVLFVFYLMLNITDHLTRWIAARLTGTENSKRCWLGILKKLGYWVMIALGFGMSAIFIEIGETIGVNLHVTTMIGWFVLAALIMNEIRSIFENLVEAGYKIPNALIKGLEVANKAIDGKIKISDEGIELVSFLTDDELQAKGKTTLEVEDNRSGGKQ